LRNITVLSSESVVAENAWMLRLNYNLRSHIGLTCLCERFGLFIALEMVTGLAGFIEVPSDCAQLKLRKSFLTITF
jgi:hypothetical protein